MDQMNPGSAPQKVVYFAQLDVASFPGVAKKIQQTVQVLGRQGFDAILSVETRTGLKGLWGLLVAMWRVRTDVLVLRTTYFTMHVLALALLWQRLLGTRVIVEVPTPNAVVWRELQLQLAHAPLKRWARSVFMATSLPWSLWPAHKVVQYAPESAWFSWGLNRRTELHANGLDVNPIPERAAAPMWSGDRLVVLGMGALAPWHGYDRLIRAMAKGAAHPADPSRRVAVEFWVVGDGEVCAQWQALAHELGVGQDLKFLGPMTGRALDGLFDQAHLAVGSLGLYRKGLSMASDLKSREYTARGIPFLAAGVDLDFQSDTPFRLSLPNSDQSLDLNEVVRWFDDLMRSGWSVRQTRAYAHQHLDFAVKVKQLIAPAVGSSA